MEHLYQNLADIVLLLHALFVVFIVASTLLTIVGGFRKWLWVRNWWFRIIHLAGTIIVLAQSWVGLVCPLTTLEMWLRGLSGGAQYEGGFIQHWLERFLYYDLPEWGFVVVYTVFGLLVVITWVRFPPQKTLSAKRQDS